MELTSQNNYQTLNDQINNNPPASNYQNISSNNNNQWGNNNQNSSQNVNYDKSYSNIQQNNQKISDFSDSTDLSKKARSGFIMKVYLILAIQLAITVALCVMSATITDFYIFQIENQWIFWITFPVMIIVQIAIFCCPIGRKHPWNLLCLLIFTICQAWVISYSTSYVIYIYDDPMTVIIAASMTLAIVLGLTLYAMFTRFTMKDFLIMWGILIVVLLAMLMVGIISIFTYSPVLTNIYCGLGVIIFGIYLIFDTKMIVGGQRIALSLDDYVVGALLLYIDIIMIFLYLLQMMSNSRRR